MILRGNVFLSKGIKRYTKFLKFLQIPKNYFLSQNLNLLPSLVFVVKSGGKKYIKHFFVPHAQFSKESTNSNTKSNLDIFSFFIYEC